MKKLLNNKKLTKKEYARLWVMADKEIKEWIRFKCELFAEYNEQQKTKNK